jgi:hypothetical protein
MKAKLLYTTHILLVLIVAWGLGFSQARGQANTQLTKPVAQAYFRQPIIKYQGVLKENGAPVTGTRSLTFELHDADDCSGTPLGTSAANRPISNGLFTADLDFGSEVINGQPLWLRVLVAGTEVSCTEITSVPYALFADKVPWSGVMDRPANTIVVAKSGGDFNTIKEALDSISPTADQRYLIYVAPGVYTETVTMKPYVDIEGAGEDLTRITYTGSAAFNTGTVVGAYYAELRFLSVSNTGGAAYAIAIYNHFALPHLTHVTANASGGITTNYGVYNSGCSPVMTSVTASASGGTTSIGVYNNFSSPEMTNMNASASGATTNYGVYNFTSSPKMTNVNASASEGTGSYGVFNGNSSPAIQNSLISARYGTNNYGIYNSATESAYTVKINHSQVTGSTNTIYNDSHYTTRVGTTLLDGGAALANSGTLTCAGVYDESYVFYANTCP